MATDATPAPTDADLRTMAEGSALMLRDSYTTNWFATEAGLLAFARAVLAKWGAQPAASPAPVELGPDGKEWAKTLAGYAHVDSVKPHAHGELLGAPVWHGWAVREAFVAGAEWQEMRSTKQGTSK